MVLTESQVAALEAAKQEKEAHGQIETEHPGYLGSQDTFYVGTIKGVGRIYQQTFIDTYSRVGFAKLYLQKHAITAADLLNDRVIPFFEEHEIDLLRILTDRGTEYCGKKNQHEYQLYLGAGKTLITPEPRPKVLRQTASASVSTRRCSKSFIKLHFAKRSIEVSTSCKPIWING